MIKKFRLFSLLSLCISSGYWVFSQSASPCREVLASAGGDALLGNKKWEFTLGESFIETLENGTGILTHGFHQPERCPISTSISEISAASGLSIFPNPTVEELHLRFMAPSGKVFSMQIFNAVGQCVQHLLTSDDTQAPIIDCRPFPSGAYFLVARMLDGSLFFQVPFVKTDR